MKLIPLTQNYRAMVDDEDYDELMQYRWSISRIGKSIYAYRSDHFHGSMHQYITGFDMTDHFDGNGLNNCRRMNLREVTRSLNNLNRTKARGGTSRYLGVCWWSHRQIWKSTCPSLDAYDIGPRGRKPGSAHLGYFDSEEEAAHARDEGMRLRFGLFGTYNFPNVGERSAITGLVVGLPDSRIYTEGLAGPELEPRPAVQMRSQRGGSSRFRWVHWSTAHGRWAARCLPHPVIDSGRKSTSVWLGLFQDQEEAAMAVDEATWIRSGRGGAYNFPRPGCRSALTGEMWPG